MSIINSAAPGSHIESLFLLDRLISDFSRSKPDGRLTEEQIKTFCVPEYLLLDSSKDANGEFKVKKNPAKKLRESLEFWRDRDLWDHNDVGLRSYSELDCADNLPARLLKTICEQEYDFLNGNKIEPLLRYLTLMMAVDKHTFVGQQVLDRSSAQTLVASVVDSSNVGRMNLNDSETKSFFDYAHLLGFLEQVDKETYFVDPTRALKVLLDANFQVNEELLCDAFLARLNHKLPIFDQGEYRRVMEEVIVRDNDQWAPEQGIRLSASLSIALYRLRREGVVAYRMGSDSATRYYLTLPTGEITEITHLTYLGVPA
ncbi:protein DpdG [Vibrio fortis]|uniref:protein DpdG n=1 Tax=Vibrio fortis TaxID=212667 RepID=UPI0036F304E3